MALERLIDLFWLIWTFIENNFGALIFVLVLVLIVKVTYTGIKNLICRIVAVLVTLLLMNWLFPDMVVSLLGSATQDKLKALSDWICDLISAIPMPLIFN